MIYTITLNPSLDYIVTVPEFALGATNRTSEEIILAGGKGVNVSLVLNNLGFENTALGFEGGFVGKEIVRRLGQIGCHADFISVKNGTSRINVKLKNYEGTEINGIGPMPDDSELERLFSAIQKLKDGDVLVLAGSVPATVTDLIYQRIMKCIRGRKIDVVVDAAKKLLVPALEEAPFLIKPNKDELEDIFSKKITSKKEIKKYAEKLQCMGAKNVLVSMAGDGAFLMAEDGHCYESGALKGTLVNGVGAGDSMVAGFLAGWLTAHDYPYAFHMGVAAGSASAFSDGLAAKNEVEQLLLQFS